MTTVSSETLHASCVAINGRAVLIEGPSGSGKSDLALRLIDRGGKLVSDDYTLLVRDKDRLIARPPATIAGRIEIRGIGICDMPHLADVPIALVVVLQPIVERMPEPREPRRIAGITLPEIALVATEPSAPIKVELALARLGPPA
jgi:serine kinase of HPr protein (carbohydrate metabolism regulator)